MDFNYKQFGYGFIAGTCGILISHPFDTIKTNLQNCAKNNTKLNISYSLSNLYKGLTPAIIGMGFEKALVFGTYSNVKSLTDNTFISGGLAGFIASSIVTPAERLKILYQSNNRIDINLLMKHKIGYFYKGLTATFTREVPGFAIYFSVYEKLRQYNKENSLYKSWLFGASSGIISWIFIYPQDTIKTIMQSNNGNEKFTFIFKSLLKNNNIFGFYKGFGYCLLRIIPLHGTVLMSMEIINNMDIIL